LRDEANPTHQLNTHPIGYNQAAITDTSAERTARFCHRGTGLKKITVAVLDNTELRYAGLLEDAGLNRSTARVIVCLMVRNNITIRQIATATEMTSASVTVAIRKLRESGMIRYEESVSGKISERLYRLVGDWECILAMIEEQERKKVSGYVEKSGEVMREIKNKYSYLLARPR
jgi:predicted transcriptional regulator